MLKRGKKAICCGEDFRRRRRERERSFYEKYLWTKTPSLLSMRTPKRGREEKRTREEEEEEKKRRREEKNKRRRKEEKQAVS